LIRPFRRFRAGQRLTEDAEPQELGLRPSTMPRYAYASSSSRGWLCAVALVAAMVSGCAAADQAVSGASPKPPSSHSPGEDAPVDRIPSTTPTPLQCGGPFSLPATRGLLTVSGQFQARAPAKDGSVSSHVDVTAGGAVRGVMAPSADGFLVRDGRIVTLPAPQDLMGVRLTLAPGTVHRLPALVSLEPCAAATAALLPGPYELYVRVVVTRDDGSALESFGGPWAIEME
jgi:hypothetical protein